METKNAFTSKTLLLAVIFLLLFAMPASAADPECANPATEVACGIGFCSGEVLPTMEDLASCEVRGTHDGVAFTIPYLVSDSKGLEYFPTDFSGLNYPIVYAPVCIDTTGRESEVASPGGSCFLPSKPFIVD